MRRQLGAAQQHLGRQRNLYDSPRSDLLSPPFPRWLGQLQFSRPVLERYFPQTRMTDMKLRGGMIERCGCNCAQPRRFPSEPDERARIQKQLHSNPISFIPASSSGAKQSSVQEIGPEVTVPTLGRLPADEGIGTIRATGSLSLRRTTSSPLATTWSSWEKCVSAYASVVSIHQNSQASGCTSSQVKAIGPQGLPIHHKCGRQMCGRSSDHDYD
jgi:hypothetical protein